MSGLLFLSQDDFSVQRGTKGNVLCTSVRGISLVLFYSTQCVHCQSLIPIFKKLPGNVGGCQFGMINLSHNKKCLIMSKETIAPIKVVPYIILYINGKPYMRYNGPHDPNEIARFIVEVSEKLRNKQTFSNEDKRVKENPDTGIPDYTTGIPLCGPDNKVCYLDFNDAYGKDKISDTNDKHRQRLPSQAGMGMTGR